MTWWIAGLINGAVVLAVCGLALGAVALLRGLERVVHWCWRKLR